MAIVAGVDFGTLSVRVSIMDSERGRLGDGGGGVSAASQARRSGLRDAVACRPDAGAGGGHAQGSDAAGIDGEQVEAIALDTTGSSVVPVDAQHAAARRLLPVVRSSRQGRSAADHGAGARGEAGGDRLVRRRVFARVGIRQAAALAAAQSRTSARSLRRRSSTATWWRPRCAASPIRSR